MSSTDETLEVEKVPIYIDVQGGRASSGELRWTSVLHTPHIALPPEGGNTVWFLPSTTSVDVTEQKCMY